MVQHVTQGAAMTEDPSYTPLVADERAGEWKPHPRFAGIQMKQMLTSADNPAASISRVRVPPGAVIGWHHHAGQVETVYVIAGRGALTLGERETPFFSGQIVAIPSELPHTLRNDGPETVELLCIFTPPLV
jgi:quercetin dioxygenase-like cupin family protein